MNRSLKTILVIVSLILWGRIGWILACKIADSTIWRVIVALPLVMIMLSIGMILAGRILGPRPK